MWRASDSYDDAVMRFAAREIFQNAGFEVSAIVRENGQLIIDSVSKLFIIVFVKIACVSRSDSGETTRPYQIRHKHTHVLIKIEFDE
jgi:hypothetical protein